jgi:hypothetical protein
VPWNRLADRGGDLGRVRRFADLTTKWLRRGSHRSVQELEQSIRQWVATWNDNPRPFVWTRTAGETLDIVATSCQRTNTAH